MPSITMNQNRIAALDFVKGALVLLMVAYHVLNYLNYETAPRYYLGFVAMSFIMIAGFLVMNVYASRHDRGQEQAAIRLVVRAVKLLMIFTVLNIIGRLVFTSNYYGQTLSLSAYAADWVHVYIRGDAQAVAFDVLVPIAYTLALGGGVLWIKKRSDALALWVMIVALLVFGIMNLTDLSVPNGDWIAAGILGMLLGQIPLRAIDNAIAATSWRMIALMLLCYGLVVLAGLFDLVSQLAITVAWLVILYAVGQSLGAAGRWVERVGLLGRYSLLSYIAQIAYLQVTPLFLSVLPTNELLRAALLMAVIAVFTWGTAAGVDRARRGVARFDRVYRFVFA